MRVISKPILSVLAVLLGVPLILSLLLTFWLQLPGTKARLQRDLGTSLGIALQVGKLHVMPWGAIRIFDVQLGEKSQPFLATLPSVTVRPSLRDLLHGKFTVASCSLERPILQVLATSQPPQNTPAPTNAPSQPLLEPSSLVIQATSQSLPSLNKPSAPETPCRVSLPAHLSVRNGEFHLMDASSRSITSLSGVNLVHHGSSGVLRATNAAIGSSLVFRDLKGELFNDQDSLLLQGISARFGGGSVAGNLRCSLPVSPSPRYSCHLELVGANLKSLIAEGFPGSAAASGTVSATLSLDGIAGQGSTMSGNGSILCREGVIQPADFLRQLGRMLNIEELQLLRLSEAKCLFRIQEGRFLIDDLLLRSENLMLAAKGPVLGSGELDLESRLLFNEGLTARLKGVLGSRLSPAPEAGYSQIAFHVTGPALNPKTDLLERLTGIRINGDLGGFGSLLQGLFGRPQPPIPQH